MTGTILSTYLAFLLQSGASIPAPAHVTKAAPAARPVAAQRIIIEPEKRSGGPALPASQNLGAGILVSDTSAVRVAAADDANAVVDEVQKFYADIKQVTAKFRQVVTNATFGRSTTSDGKVWIQKPGKMRWDYYSKKKKKNGKSVVETLKTFISNGTYLYVIEHQNKQVIEKNLEKNMLPVAITFLYGKGDLKTDFTAELDTSKKYGAKGEIVLKLTPKTESAQYKTLFLVVNKDDFHDTQSVIIDSAGNVNHFRFYEPDFKTTIKNGLFKFDKKKVPNYRITSDDAADDADAKTTE
jgi:outer membrane lipoprotein carrier protein